MDFRRIGCNSQEKSQRAQQALLQVGVGYFGEIRVALICRIISTKKRTSMLSGSEN